MGSPVNNDKGIALLSLVVLTAMIPAVILLLLSLNTSQASHARYFNSADTLLRMKEIKNYLMYQARDRDNDGKYEPLAPTASQTLPPIPFNTTDGWGHEFLYCAWDLGGKNTVDNRFSANNVAPPDSNNDLATSLLTGRIISLGANGMLDTPNPCTAIKPLGDDVFVEFTQAEIGTIAGWVKDGPTVKLITNGDTVQVGDSATTDPGQPVKLDVQGGVLKATDGLVIQQTTANPAIPMNGQIWLRDDGIRYRTSTGIAHVTAVPE
jgi:co-chaperonin GroES (HSP10)